MYKILYTISSLLNYDEKSVRMENINFVKVFKVCKLVEISIPFQFNIEVCSFQSYRLRFFETLCIIVSDKVC